MKQHTRCAVLALIAGLTLTATVGAQGMPPAPTEMKKFDKLIGVWEGSGKAAIDESGAEGGWTANIAYQKILGGRFVQEDTLVNIQMPGAPAMTFRILYGWDPEKKRYFSFGCGNGGNSHTHEVWWRDGALLVPMDGIEEGQPMFGRAKVTVDGNKMKMEMFGAKGAHGFGKRVWGTFKRSLPVAKDGDKPGDHVERVAAKLDHSVSVVPPTDAMKKMKRLEGAWRFTGKATMPGAPEMDIAGTETFTYLHGGHTLVAKVVGDPMEGFGVYEAHGYFTWNPHSECYDMFHVSSMGEIGTGEGRWLDDETFVVVTHALMQGTPTSLRTVLKYKSGKMTAHSDHMHGADEPARAFTGNYVRKSN